MIARKAPAELGSMKAGGRITAAVLREVLESIRPGVSLLELEEIADRRIRAQGGEPSFKKVAGYRWATCLNINEGVVHGIPTDRKLVEGDLLSVDLGTYYQGFHTDASWTVLVGEGDGEKRRFLQTGEEALRKSIAQARVGNRVRDISAAMQGVLEKAGYAPVDILVGHGIGKELHEDPQIPCLVLHDGESPRLEEGMNLAIEAIYTAGSPELEIAEDGWTFVTKDGSWAGLFEHTVAVTDKEPIILTEQE